MTTPAFPPSGNEERLLSLRALIDQGLTFGECVEEFATRQTDSEKRYAVAANESWHRDGEIEIDDGAIVSLSDDKGAYVMAWVWVTDEDAGVDDDPGDLCGLCGIRPPAGPGLTACGSCA